jgi:V8-like Glu-specific endopeptidase
MYKGLVAVTLIVLFALPSPAIAITNGQPDANRHPYVGLVVFYVLNSTNQLEAQWRCSGSLVSSTVFVTAGHCTFGADWARIWFTPGLLPYDPAHGYPYYGYDASGIPIAMPGYRSEPLPGLPGFDYHDVGLVVLTRRYKLSSYARLPSVGLVDSLPMKTEVTVVGYGVQQKAQISGPPYDRWIGRTRMYAPSQIIQSDDAIAYEYLKLTENSGQGKGGTCFGDSGGPVLYNGNTIIAVTSFGSNDNCAGVGYYNRIDTADALAYINSLLAR